jgi:hypothetical protein
MSLFLWVEAQGVTIKESDRLFTLSFRELKKRADFSPVNPDIAAFHPEHRSWGFFEVKMPQDKICNNQIRSLALLKHVLSVRVGIIRLVPNGKARAPLTVLTSPT